MATETKSKKSSSKKSKTAEVTTDQADGEVLSDGTSDQRVASFPGAVPSEQFPERRASDVDVKDVDPGSGKGEHLPPLNAETFVVLDGSHKLVPDEYDGKIAAVLSFPRGIKHDEDTGETYEYLPPKGSYEVKELSQGARFFLPLEAFKDISTNGRASLLRFA